MSLVVEFVLGFPDHLATLTSDLPQPELAAMTRTRLMTEIATWICIVETL